jgi:hypothetical protein
MVSLDVVGALGLATKQAVSKSGDPKKWLESRLRRQLPSHPSYHRVRLVRALPGIGGSFLEQARQRLEQLPKSREGSKGRPQKRAPEELAAFLGVLPRRNMGLYEVFRVWVRREIRAAQKALRKYNKLQKKEVALSLPFYRVQQLLDKFWLPRWVRRKVGVEFDRAHRFRFNEPEGPSVTIQTDPEAWTPLIDEDIPIWDS